MYKIKRFSVTQESCPKEMLERAKKSGVIQKDKNGDWRIISLKKGTLWNSKYQSEASAKKALAAYHIHKGK
jgi:hypothetical protein